MSSLTRTEFYSAMGSVWLYIAILLGKGLRFETRRWPDVVLWAVALLFSLYYGVRNIRSLKNPVSA